MSFCPAASSPAEFAVPDAEYVEGQAGQYVDADGLDQHTGKHGRNRRRRRRVCIRQPGVERHQGRLEGESANEQTEGEQQGRIHAGLGNTHGHVRHVQRAGDAVNQRHTDQDQGRGQGAQNDIFK